MQRAGRDDGILDSAASAADGVRYELRVSEICLAVMVKMDHGAVG